jgi:serine/threonine protein kinase
MVLRSSQWDELIQNGLITSAAKADSNSLEELVNKGLLTPFQVSKINEGKLSDLLIGSYVLLDKLGVGGMGSVFKAKHRKMRRIAAIKILSAELLNSEEGQLRFQREIEVVARLCHPNVVQAYDAGECSAGQYLNGSEIINTRHEVLDMDAYVHITSPIRRLVDLLNMIKLQLVTGILPSSEVSEGFYNKWIGELDYINVTMRSIRKVQCDCTLLDICHTSPETMDKEYDGYLFDKISRNDGLFQYVVYLPELKLSSRLTMRDDIENFTHRKFKLYLFDNEDKFKRKIRLQVLQS